MEVFTDLLIINATACGLPATKQKVHIHIVHIIV